jgi:hypothetical protein
VLGDRVQGEFSCFDPDDSVLMIYHLPKGKTLRKFVEGYPFLHNTIATVVTQRYQISLDDLPPYEDEKSCAAYEAKLCRDFIIARFGDDATAEADAQGQTDGETEAGEGLGEVDVMDENGMDELVDDAGDNSRPELVSFCALCGLKITHGLLPYRVGLVRIP